MADRWRRGVDAAGKRLAVPIGASAGRWWGRVLVATAAGVGLVVWALVHAGGEAAERMVSLAVVVLGAVAWGLVIRSVAWVSGGVVGVAALCALAVIDEPGTVAIGMGVGLFLFAELAFGALDIGPIGATNTLGGRQRRRYITVVALLSTVVGGMALRLADDVAGTPNPAIEAVGAIAIAGTVGLVIFLSRPAE